MIRRLVTFCAMVLMIGNVRGALLCEIDLTSPNMCNNYISDYRVDSNRIYDCSGGSSVTEFEVWGGCGPYVYSDIPGTIETPSGVQYATIAVGRYCYCQIKSINGGANVASSPRWVFYSDLGWTGCVNSCARYCALFATDYVYRSKMFQALQ